MLAIPSATAGRIPLACLSLAIVFRSSQADNLVWFVTAAHTAGVRPDSSGINRFISVSILQQEKVGACCF